MASSRALTMTEGSIPFSRLSWSMIWFSVADADILFSAYHSLLLPFKSQLSSRYVLEINDYWAGYAALARNFQRHAAPFARRNLSPDTALAVFKRRFQHYFCLLPNKALEIALAL